MEPRKEDENADLILPTIDTIKHKKREQSPPNSKNENSYVSLPPPTDPLTFALNPQNQQSRQKDDTRELPPISSLVANSDVQNPTCFPNQNSKRIDYVIFYKYSLKETQAEFNKHELIRKSFLDRVIAEGIEVEHLRYSEDNNINVFVLLHCPIERLLIEAERLKLQMNIKKVGVFFLIQNICFFFF
jgi:hypothetical protein